MGMHRTPSTMAPSVNNAGQRRTEPLDGHGKYAPTKSDTGWCGKLSAQSASKRTARLLRTMVTIALTVCQCPSSG